VLLQHHDRRRPGKALASAFERKYGVRAVHWRGSAEKM